MLRKLVWIFVILPLGVALLALAIANRQMVRLVLDPFAPGAPALSVEAPFFLFLFAAIIAGILLGSLATWLSQGKWRRSARARGREAAEWRERADRLSRQAEAAPPRLPEATAAD